MILVNCIETLKNTGGFGHTS